MAEALSYRQKAPRNQMVVLGDHYAIGADGGTRTRTPLRTTDFKSVASTIPPHPLDHAQTALRVAGQEPLRKALICSGVRGLPCPV